MKIDYICPACGNRHVAGEPMPCFHMDRVFGPGLEHLRRARRIWLMTPNELRHRFTHHPPSAERGVLHKAIRGKLYEVAVEINGIIPEGREKSLVMTKLEEAMFWANAALARAPEQE